MQLHKGRSVLPAESSYTSELGHAICESIATGDKSLRQVSRDIGVPHSTILLWALKNEEFADQYARACEIRDEASMESLDDMRTEEPERVTISFGEDSSKTSVDSGWVAWKRVQIDTLKWQLAKRRPKKYGDKIQQEHSGEVGVLQIVSSVPRPER